MPSAPAWPSCFHDRSLRSFSPLCGVCIHGRGAGGGGGMRATARRYILQRVLLLVRSLSLSLSMPLLKVSVHVTTRSREFLSGSFRAMPSGAGLHGFGAQGSPLVPSPSPSLSPSHPSPYTTWSLDGIDGTGRVREGGPAEWAVRDCNSRSQPRWLAAW